MAEAAVESRPPPVRFFCHKCNIEFEHDVLQDYTCPFCSGGFIEQLEDTDPSRGPSAARTGSTRRTSTSGDDSNVIDMTNLDDSEEFSQETPQLGLGHDLAFLMYNNQIRLPNSSPLNISYESHLLRLMEHVTGNITGGGSPMVLVGGAPGDIVVSGEGLDAVMSQLLWQAETDGPPPLGAEAIANLPEVVVSESQEEQSMQCSVCWEAFVKDEKVRELLCGHLYHQACITPWLTLHATCPICRKSLSPEGARPATPTADLGTPPGLSFLFRACGVPLPPGGLAGQSASSANPAAPGTAPQGPAGIASVSWTTADPASRIIRPVLSLLRSMSSPTTSSNNPEQRPRPPPPPSNYDMDLEFD